MKKLLLILSIIPTILLSGCGTKTVMNQIMSSWEGYHVDSVINQWGYPDYEKNMVGRKLIIWEHNESEYVSDGFWVKKYCIRTLEVDSNNIVISWEWKGNDCPYFKFNKYKKWRNKELVELLQNDEFTNEVLNAYNLFNKDNLTKTQKEQLSFLLESIESDSTKLEH